jgi:drug/metabolite transporter (DMT)-like permease
VFILKETNAQLHDNLHNVLQAIGDYLVFKKVFSTNLKLALALAGLGSCIYVYFDLDFSASANQDNQMLGYFWVAINTVLFVIGQLWEKYAMTKSSDQTALGISTIKNILSLPVFLAISCTQIAYNVVYNGEQVSVPRLNQLSVNAWFVIFLTGVGCFFISIVYMTLYKISNATSITVGGNFNKIVSIVAAALIFSGKQLKFEAILGLLVSICGSVWYSLEEIRMKEASKKAAKKS